MAIAHVQTATGTAANAAAAGATFAGAPTQGNLLVAHVSRASTTAPTTSAGWTALGTAAAPSAADTSRQYYKIAGAGEAAAQQVVDASAGAAVVIITEYSGINTSSPLDVTVDGLVATTANPLSSNVDPVDGVERLIVGSVHSAGSQTMSAEQVNADGTSVNERGDLANGINTMGALWDKIEASTAAGNYNTGGTKSASAAGATHIAIFAAATATTPAFRLSLLGVGR